ncbi:uncharacterized protein LOC144435038 isoform X1 [Glandiceps talaboti]
MCRTFPLDENIKMKNMTYELQKLIPNFKMIEKLGGNCGPGSASDGLGGCFDCNVCDERPDILGCSNCQDETTLGESLTSDPSFISSVLSPFPDPTTITKQIASLTSPVDVVIIVLASLCVLLVVASALYFYRRLCSKHTTCNVADIENGVENTQVKLPITTFVTFNPLKNKTEEKKTTAAEEGPHIVPEIPTVINLPRDEQPVCHPQDGSSHDNTDCTASESYPREGIVTHPATLETNVDNKKTQIVVN